MFIQIELLKICPPLAFFVTKMRQRGGAVSESKQRQGVSDPFVLCLEPILLAPTKCRFTSKIRLLHGSRKSASWLKAARLVALRKAWTDLPDEDSFCQCVQVLDF